MLKLLLLAVLVASPKTPTKTKPLTHTLQEFRQLCEHRYMTELHNPATNDKAKEHYTACLKKNGIIK